MLCQTVAFVLGTKYMVECMPGSILYLVVIRKNKKNLAGYSAVRSTDEWISFLDVTILLTAPPEVPGHSQLRFETQDGSYRC